MKKQVRFGSFFVFCVLSILSCTACDDDVGTSSAQQSDESCIPNCQDNETCQNGECVKKTNEDNTCEPACSDDEECVEGECLLKTKTEEPDESFVDEDEPPEDDQSLLDDEAVTTTDESAFIINPVDDLVTVQGQLNAVFNVTLSAAPTKNVIIPVKTNNTKAGTLSAESLEFTPDNWNNQQTVEITGATETLSETATKYTIEVGPSQSDDENFNQLKAVELHVTHYSLNSEASAVLPKSLKLDKTEADLPLKGPAVTITASIDKEATDQIVNWKIENLTDKVAYPQLISVQYNMEKHSITLQSNVELNTQNCRDMHLDYARTLKITAYHSSGLTSSATVELKPYLPTGLTLTQLKKIKDFNTPGHKNLKSAEKDYKLGEMGCQYYDEHTTQVLSADMVSRYVTPYVYTVGDSSYGTRASVLGAARFLVTQFPKDIPYTSGAMYNNESVPPTIGRYSWTSYDYNEDRNKVRIFGFNLIPKAYNSFSSFKDSNVILKDSAITPWGCEAKTTSGGVVKSGDTVVENPYNGLRCSGFVAWSMMNGRYYLGDWNTILFARNGTCKDTKGNYLRNYQCEELVYDKQKDKNGKKYHWSNANGKHFALYSKLNQLKEEDFVPISSLTERSEFKAGDLLWYGSYSCPYTNNTCQTGNNQCSKGSGHVAMILGISRNSDKTIKYVYVAEATGKAGNHLAAYSISALKDKWKSTKTKKSSTTCTYKDTRLIKLDSVYNYYHTKNPDKVKEDLNTYKYTELWF